MHEKVRYKISASREGVCITVDEHFWSDIVVDPKTGTTQLDHNIETVIQDIRTAFYLVATDGTKH